MVHPGGAPRTTSPSPEECIELGKDLVRWASEKPTEGQLKTNFSYWYAIEQFMTLKEWKALKQIPQFLPYYQKARAILHNNLVRGDVKEGIAHRYLRLYDQELKEEEDETVKFKEEVKKQESVNVYINKEDQIVQK